MKSKKAQATAVATFILIMALFMLAYVLLLPEEKRQELIDDLETDEDDEDEDEEEVEGQINLLYTSPGYVYTHEKDEISIPISPISLYAKTEEFVKELAAKLTVTKSWFSDSPEVLTFKVDDTNSLEKLQLFFFVNSGEGTIYIKFNGYTVFEGDISSSDSPINLPVDRAKTTNILKIGMLSGDFAGDSYTLSSVSVKQNLKSEKSRETRIFQLTSGEKEGLKKAKLTYFVNCYKLDPKLQGDLTVILNGRELFTEHVFCDAGTQTQTLSKAFLVAGRNSIEFRITKGEYSIEGLEFELETTDKYFPQYNFELSDEHYDNIKDDEEDVYMLFRFKNDEDRKKAAVTINEYQVSFDTYDDVYERKISSYLDRGTNYIKIVPKIDFEVTSLKIYLIEEEE